MSGMSRCNEGKKIKEMEEEAVNPAVRASQLKAHRLAGSSGLD